MGDGVGGGAVTLYIVRNQEGRYFHAVGYGGGPNRSWTEDIEKARIYVKLGQARSRVSYFATRWPDFGVPDVVELRAEVVGVVDDAARVAKVKERAVTKEARRRAADAKQRMKQAEAELARAQAEIARLGGAS